MKHYQLLLITVLAIISEIKADCGCLKCSKDLQIVSPPYLPYKVIVKGSPCSDQQPFPYQQIQQIQQIAPSYIPIPAQSQYQLGSYSSACQPIFAYKYKVQAPLVLPPPPPPPLTGLVARPDRVVIQRPNCPVYTGEDGDCGNLLRPPCRSIFEDGYYGGSAPLQQVQILGTANRGPLLQPVTDDVFQKISCDCRS
ncbi:uncharacterized protein LOC135137837 [Zophobas morio]|uniref:uncharacterized protein LOC135137837 n=1 Tax=Zophobas morio TaxID=2755281 RepID=UPI003082C0AD